MDKNELVDLANDLQFSSGDLPKFKYEIKHKDGFVINVGSNGGRFNGLGGAKYSLIRHLKIKIPWKIWYKTGKRSAITWEEAKFTANYLLDAGIISIVEVES
jgi:hypothetical protein